MFTTKWGLFMDSDLQGGGDLLNLGRFLCISQILNNIP